MSTPPPYPIKAVRSEFTDHATLEALYAYCVAGNRRVALIGFNEYSKHLVNLCADRVVGFYDPEEWKHGITFRGKPVAGASDILDATHLVVCDYALAYDYAAQVAARHPGKVEIFAPARFEGKSTHLINPFQQESLYKTIFAQAGAAPLTMMSKEKIGFLMECLRQGLTRPGDVLEIGVWQAGSAWYLGKVLALTGQDRRLYLIDPFEQPLNSTGTMCNEEIRRRMSFYPHTLVIPGVADDKTILGELRSRKFCFLHCDLGFRHARAALAALWDCMEPGALLLFDNYGHANTDPIEMEKFYAERGARVMRLPWSEQGFVIR